MVKSTQLVGNQFGSDIERTNHSYFVKENMGFIVAIISKSTPSTLLRILLDAVKDWAKKPGNDKLVELCYQNVQDQILISATLVLIHISIGITSNLCHWNQ